MPRRGGKARVGRDCIAPAGRLWLRPPDVRAKLVAGFGQTGKRRGRSPSACWDGDKECSAEFGRRTACVSDSAPLLLLLLLLLFQATRPTPAPAAASAMRRISLAW